MNAGLIEAAVRRHVDPRSQLLIPEAAVRYRCGTYSDYADICTGIVAVSVAWHPLGERIQIADAMFADQQYDLLADATPAPACASSYGLCE